MRAGSLPHMAWLHCSFGWNFLSPGHLRVVVAEAKLCSITVNILECWPDSEQVISAQINKTGDHLFLMHVDPSESPESVMTMTLDCVAFLFCGDGSAGLR